MLQHLAAKEGLWEKIGWSFLVLMSSLFAFLAIKNSFPLSCNDTFYYLSIADNMIANHTFLDGTTIPAGPIVTPQNGIVFIFFLFRKCGFSHQTCIDMILVINAIGLFMSVFPLMAIAEAVGIRDRFIKLAVVAAYLGGVRVFLWMYLSPINDMIFLVLSLYLMQLLIHMDRQLYGQGNTCNGILKVFGLSLVLCVLLPHFRVNAFFVPLAGMAGSILLKRFRMGLLAALQFGVMLASMFGVYLLLKGLGYEFRFNEMQGALTSFHLYDFFFSLLPESLFRNLSQSGNLLYFPFYIAMALAFVDGIRQKNMTLLMVLFICIMTMAITIVFAMPLSRYLWPITAFMYMFVLRNKQLRLFGVLFICAVVINSFWMIYDGITVPQRTKFWQYAARKVSRDKNGAVLISQNHRSSWYFMDIPAIKDNNYTWEQLKNAANVYIGGDADFVQRQQEAINQMANQHGHPVSFETMTPGFQDRIGRALYHLRFTSSEN